MKLMYSCTCYWMLYCWWIPWMLHVSKVCVLTIWNCWDQYTVQFWLHVCWSRFILLLSVFATVVVSFCYCCWQFLYTVVVSFCCNLLQPDLLFAEPNWATLLKKVLNTDKALYSATQCLHIEHLTEAGSGMTVWTAFLPKLCLWQWQHASLFKVAPLYLNCR